MSAQSASAIDAANPFPDPATAGAELRTVLLPGSPATYANRAFLREMGLHWDPAGHRWHGTTTADQVRTLRERLGLEVRCFGTLEPPPGPSPPRPATPIRAIATPAILSRDPARHTHDGSRTRLEARTTYPASREEPDEIVAPCRRFSLLDITSGLPDDSREADEKLADWQYRELRARVKKARAVVSTTPGLAKTLQRDWQKAARFYARSGITERQFRLGVPADSVGTDVDKLETITSHPSDLE